MTREGAGTADTGLQSQTYTSSLLSREATR